MGRVVAFLKSGYFISGLGVVLLVAAILVLGAWLDWPSAVQFIAIIGVLVLCILALAVSMLRANKNSALIEQSLKMQATQQRMNTRPDQKAEFEDLQKQFDVAIERLKQSKLGRGGKGKAALHALPWYVFVGPPGTGKTTAIVNSGLNFPIGTNRIRGVGGTRNCDWFFTDSAILLDTAGRYVTEDEDRDEWHVFLDTLKKYRPERPVNGIIVAISAATLAEATYDEIEWHADTIRTRVDELLSRLGVRFPVYLMFTKCDLLDGFVEFFGELPRKEREQIWGCTLDRDQSRSLDVRTVFEHEYRRLYDTMLNHRIARLSRAMKRDERRKVYAFPLQFASIKDKLSLFVGRMFQPNPYQESPVFRGFYFSSGTQEGAPIDHVIRSIAGQLDVRTEPDEIEDFEVETKSYFIKDLFTDVVIPDQYMVQATSRAASRARLARMGTAVASVVLVGLLILAFAQALFRSQADLGSVQAAAMLVGPLRPGSSGSASEDLAALEEMRLRVMTLEQNETSPPLLQLGLHRSGTVLDPARRLYLNRVRTLFDRTAFSPVDRRLRSGLQGAVQITDGERDSLYSDLRAYLLLTSETKRLEEEVNQRFLERYLTALVGRQVLSSVGASQRTEAEEQLGNQVSYYVGALQGGLVAPYEGNAGVVGQMRRVVYQPPSPGLVYQRMKEEADLSLQPFTLAEATQGRYLELFSEPQEVPGLFTQRGWETFVQDAIKRETESPDRADWVMGYSSNELPESMKNPEVFAEQLWQMYFGEYAAAWERFLRGIRVQRFRDLASASQGMKDLGSSYDSPLLYILAHVTTQTKFDDGGLAENLADRAVSAATRKADQKSRAVVGKEGQIDRPVVDDTVHPVTARFKRLHDLQADQAQSGGASPALLRALEGIGKVAGILEGVQGDPAKAADYAKQIVTSDGGELGATINAVNSAMGQLDPDVRKALFTEAVTSAWEVIAGSAQQHLNDRWAAEVVRPYGQIAGRFPLAASSDQDIPIEDFENFFRPGEGALFVFWSETLAPFVSSDGRSARSWSGRGIRISPAVLNAYEKAQKMGDALFQGGALRAQFELQPDLPAREETAPAVSLVELEVHGTRSSYAMGSNRPWTQVTWPGSPGASIRLSTQTGSPSLDFRGDWAWFRMLQAGRLQRNGATEYEVMWPFPNGVTARYLLRTRSSSNPFGNMSGFFNLDLPSTLN